MTWVQVRTNGWVIHNMDKRSYDYNWIMNINIISWLDQYQPKLLRYSFLKCFKIIFSYHFL